MTFEYKPVGVCARRFTFEIEENTVKSASFENGCDGNLEAIARLIKNRPVEEVIQSLTGIDCEGRGNSCPNQIAVALTEYLDQDTV